jgi:hypothetical protein
MEGIWLVFLVVFALNLLPAFAPPTWMALSFFSYKFPDNDIAILALVGATAATLGRVILAKFARTIVRGKLLSEDTRENIDAIRDSLQKRRAWTAGASLFYAFSPLPSNYLFYRLWADHSGAASVGVAIFSGAAHWVQLLGAPRLGCSAQAGSRGAGEVYERLLCFWCRWHVWR